MALVLSLANKNSTRLDDAPVLKRPTDCVDRYLESWQLTATRCPELVPVVRDMVRCAERNLGYHRAGTQPLSGRAYTCKRPGCLNCYSLKHAATELRLHRMISHADPEWGAIIAARFATTTVPFAAVGKAVTSTMDTWAKAIRTEHMRSLVTAWARVIEIRHSDEDGLVDVDFKAIMRLIGHAKGAHTELAAYQIAGLFSRYRWQPLEFLDFSDVDLFQPEALRAATSALATSGFDPRCFCSHLGSGLEVTPESLVALHEGLHNRHLVHFSKGKAP